MWRGRSTSASWTKHPRLPVGQRRGLGLAGNQGLKRGRARSRGNELQPATGPALKFRFYGSFFLEGDAASNRVYHAIHQTES